MFNMGKTTLYDIGQVCKHKEVRHWYCGKLVRIKYGNKITDENMIKDKFSKRVYDTADQKMICNKVKCELTCPIRNK